MRWAAVVLAGGKAARMGGVDKPALVVGGRTLLDRVISAVAHADEIIVVGPPRPTVHPVRWTREPEPGSGPVAGMAAGLDLVTAEVVVLLAADLPALTRATVDRLRAAPPAVLVDADGRDQWLLGAWPTAALRAATPAEPANAALRRVLTGLAPVRLGDVDGSARDVDQPSDLADPVPRTGTPFPE
ncbi:molybdenum cofactor guanylyltransferase [Actinokineospora globicatena]|uniref:molybdenum cofactor guanylyltransferase n=1 Tax=Actinokineospora globicatena TaxID=103729 RepID=UPI0020A294FA|nr:molybdenum cofactor guanylyltransferase [Actinokineospora globicatena]MCP2304686.1 Molybdopterin-guanine dinucleotide biosynthesis protein A [Actinokineospora globicatena]GLW77939.1 molybdenum cofactor guanylyltransferase [Actinokineospora globicatena]